MVFFHFYSAASDLGLHCLSLSHQKDARLICVKRVSSMYLRCVLGFDLNNLGKTDPQEIDRTYKI